VIHSDIFRTIVAVYLKVTRERNLIKLTDVSGYIEKLFLQCIFYDKKPETRAERLLDLWRTTKDNQILIKVVLSHGANVRRLLSEIAEAGLDEETEPDKEQIRLKMNKLIPFMKFQEKKDLNNEILDEFTDLIYHDKELLKKIQNITYMEFRQQLFYHII